MHTTDMTSHNDINNRNEVLALPPLTLMNTLLLFESGRSSRGLHDNPIHDSGIVRKKSRDLIFGAALRQWVVVNIAAGRRCLRWCLAYAKNAGRAFGRVLLLCSERDLASSHVSVVEGAVEDSESCLGLVIGY